MDFVICERKRPATGLFLFIIFCLILALQGCSDSGKKAPAAKVSVKIAAVLPLTGPRAYLGAGEKNAIELAVQEINRAAGRIVIEVVFADSKDDPAEAAVAANNLLRTEKVSAFITSGISVSRALLPIVTKGKKIIAMLCMDPTIQQMSPYAFRLYESMSDEADQILKYYSLNRTGKKTVILFLNRHRTAFQVSNYLIPGFMKEGVRTLYYEPYSADEKDFTSRVERLKLSGADSLLILGSGIEYPTIIREIARADLAGKIEIVGGWGFLTSDDARSEFTEGIVVVGPQYIYRKNEKAVQFEESFAKVYGRAPNFDAAFAYDAVNILSEGLIKGLIESGGDAETVSYLITNHKFKGVMGDTSVDNEGGLKVPMGIGIIRHGKIMAHPSVKEKT